MAFRDEELVGEAKVHDATWKVTRLAGMFRIWTDAADPRYVISADIPCEIFEAMARDVAARNRQQHGPVELGPNVDLLEVKSTATNSERTSPREQVLREAINESDYP
jgi:hypothetical protein